MSKVVDKVVDKVVNGQDSEWERTRVAKKKEKKKDSPSLSFLLHNNLMDDVAPGYAGYLRIRLHRLMHQKNALVALMQNSTVTSRDIMFQTINSSGI